MNKINPLILISILAAVLLVLSFNVSRLKNQIAEKDKALFALEENAKKIVFSKKTWNKTELKERLGTVFGAGNVNDKGKNFEIKVSSLTRMQVNDMVRKMLTDGFEIEKFTILTEAEDKISLGAEITK
ncbi:MAG: hypothetical protein LBB59_04010 [Campylobacteraceae bacterium]|jgi:regulator of replication initiation timing|nr:hypothetical protein [Campylobacteraceae bacterium]